MQELERLIGVIEKRAANSVIKFRDATDNTLETKLYQLIRSKKAVSESALKEALYGNSKEAKGYKMLKTRLKKKLYEVVDTIELNDPTLRIGVIEERKCLELINRAFTLHKIGELMLSHKVALQAIDHAKQLKGSGLLLHCYELLCRILHDENKYSLFKEYQEALERCKWIWSKELEADIIFLNARFGLKQVVAGRKEQLNLLPFAIQELEQRWLETSSLFINEHLHTLQIQYCEYTGNFQKIISITDNLEQFVQENPQAKNKIDLRFYKFIKTYALLQLRQFDVGLAYAQATESAFDYGTRNWSAFMENYFLMALQSKQLRVASNLFQKVSTSGAFCIINPPAIERWSLFVEYYKLLSGEDLSKATSFGVNGKPIFNYSVKDKEGFNVAIIILEIFKNLKKGEVEDVAVYSERIKKYIAKHLQSKEAARPRLFLKLLLLLIRENLDPKASRKKGKYLFQKLKNTPLPGNAFAEVEILTYEQLWELALSYLTKAEVQGHNSKK